jgi:UDP-GlcNAc:undecaprenyl-phosphate GlcNAc-1-phosphate transferase
MLGGMLVALLVAYHLPLLHHAFQNGRDVLAIASGAILITMLGIADDVWQLDALTKLAGQALAAGVMVSQGMQLLWLPIHGVLALPPVVGPFLTVLIVLIAINAVNFVDGLDGLAAGIVAISASSFFAYSYLLAVVHGFARANAATLITSILVGICVGFLPHNVSPARIFMGDSGSMLLGLLLASAVISLTGGLDANGLSAENLAPALLPLLLPVAVIPLIDMGLAIIRRTSAGRSPFAPDKEHLHHRLLNIGHSKKQAAFVLYLWTAAIAFPFSASAFLPLKWAVVAGVCAMALATGATLKAVARRPGARL